MKLNSLFLALAIVIFASCKKDSLDDYRPTGTAPTMGETTLTNTAPLAYTISGMVSDNGGILIQEMGICLCVADSGQPNLDNPRAITLKRENTNTNPFEMAFQLFPNGNFLVTAYAINNFGITYGETYSIQTADAEPIYFIPGTYTVGNHTPYLAATSLDSYEVTISHIRDNLYAIDSLRLYSGNAYPFHAEIEVNKKQVGDDVMYEFILPYQLTNLEYKDDATGLLYDIALVNARWVILNEEYNLDAYGTVQLQGGVSISINSGYAFNLSKKITNELVTGKYLSIILGKESFPIPAEGEADAYPDTRVDCLLTKKL